MIEIVITLLFIGGVLAIQVGLIGLAKFFEAEVLVPFIGASVFWFMAAVNFRDARTKVANTGYQYSSRQRLGALGRGVGFCVVTVPYFWLDGLWGLGAWIIAGIIILLVSSFVSD